MSDFFEKLQQNINKNVKGVHASVMADSTVATDRYWVKTPALDLNRILSGSIHKGIQSRNLVGIVGPEHTMKSSFMVLCMVEAIKQGMNAVIIDTEGGLKGSGGGLYIGAGKDLEAGTFWSGMIDDVRIYDRVVEP